MKVLVLGGYGNFGKRIVENLAEISDITVVIAGRNMEKAERLQRQLSNHCRANLACASIDVNSEHFETILLSINPDLVIHTCGPFQGQSYKVPLACIASKSHYIDLADDRRFVCDITSLDSAATENNVLIVSGASSVPGLSSVVIDHFLGEFDCLDEIDFAIAPGNKAERGEATVRGILSYTGHPFLVYENKQWLKTYGWMSPRRLFFDELIGYRYLANIDIPDLELFPARYASVKGVRFQAGLELGFLHYGMVCMAQLAKWGFVKDWSRYTSLIFRASEWFKGLGTNTGGMLIKLKGNTKNNKSMQFKWVLQAKDGVGPYIPTISAIIMAKKLLRDDVTLRGAIPCLGLFSMTDFDEEALPLGIVHHTEQTYG